MWYTAKVLLGDKTGRTIGFPTVNLDPAIILNNMPTGVYSSTVRYRDKEYKGALYYGPRLVRHETKNVLEIYILDFNKEIYGEEISFTIGQFIRGVKKFSTLGDLKKQLQADVEKIKKCSP